LIKGKIQECVILVDCTASPDYIKLFSFTRSAGEKEYNFFLNKYEGYNSLDITLIKHALCIKYNEIQV
jgi:hypothetical protein